MNNNIKTIDKNANMSETTKKKSRFLSPFRYPGGKSALCPFIEKFIVENCPDSKILIEPFAGGASVGLSALFSDVVPKIELNEIDDEVASVWKTILDEKESMVLIDKILRFEMSIENVNAVLNRNPLSETEKAFTAIIKNRTSYGGIMYKAGTFKNGDGKGIASRWNPDALVARILEIEKRRNDIIFTETDALELIENRKTDENIFFFIDPPYTAEGGKKPGRKLYKHSSLDHEKLFEICSGIKGRFIMTYDESDEIKRLASVYDFKIETIRLLGNKNAIKTELALSNN